MIVPEVAVNVVAVMTVALFPTSDVPFQSSSTTVKDVGAALNFTPNCAVDTAVNCSQIISQSDSNWPWTVFEAAELLAG